MPNGNKEKSREGVRLIQERKSDSGQTAAELAALFGYESIDSYFRICRYEYSPGDEAAEKIARFIGKDRGWVLDHWATEVSRRKNQRRVQARRAS